MESESQNALPPQHPASAPDCRFNPWLFFGFLVAPGILSILTLFADDSNYGENSLLVLGIGSVIAGLVCGIHFARSQNRLSNGVKIAVGFISVIGCAGGAFALGFGGCYLVVLGTEGF